MQGYYKAHYSYKKSKKLKLKDKEPKSELEQTSG